MELLHTLTKSTLLLLLFLLMIFLSATETSLLHFTFETHITDTATQNTRSSLVYFETFYGQRQRAGRRFVAFRSPNNKRQGEISIRQQKKRQIYVCVCPYQLCIE